VRLPECDEKKFLFPKRLGGLQIVFKRRRCAEGGVSLKEGYLQSWLFPPDSGSFYVIGYPNLKTLGTLVDILEPYKG
jgi:hypothetical protein